MTTSVVYFFENQLFNNHEIKEYMMLKQIFLKLFSTVNHIAPTFSTIIQNVLDGCAFYDGIGFDPKSSSQSLSVLYKLI